MKHLRVVSLLVALLVALASVQAPVRASSQQIYIVLLADAPLARYGGGIAGLVATDPEVTGAQRLDPNSPASQAYRNYLRQAQDQFIATMNARLGRQVELLLRYDTVLNGLALKLSAAEAQTVAGLPGVTRVHADEERQLLTDEGPEWIGAKAVWDGSQSGGVATKGEGVVVGIIDTGVNYSHPSFADVGGDGYDHTNPRDRFYGACDPLTGAPFCNEKLIGFYDFTGTTPEDTNGHGSHTASTTAGNALDAALVAPTVIIEKHISGVAPHANIISYKVCITTCPLSAILGAVNQAALDEVDVVNFSIGGGSSDPWTDLDAQAFLNAHNAGVFSAVSAGNSGPGAATIGSPADAPWVLTVGASTHDRKFVNTLQDMNGGNTPAPADMAGKSITSGYGPAPIVYAGDYGDPLCPTPFPPGTFNGEIVVCDRGVNPRVEKASNVKAGGAGGFVLANEEASGNGTVADAYAIPGVNITYNDGVTLKKWLASGSGHVATISGTDLNNINPANGDIMAAFSSRGPNPATGSLLKPDVTAPGVDIFAAWMRDAAPESDEFNVISGTSMSSPHAAGAAALVRALRPEWTPDQVKSALMSTATTQGVRKEDGATAADPFDYGAGRIDLTRASRAELVLNETASNYEAANPGLGGDPSTLNLPSLANGSCLGQCSWTRTVTNVSNVKARWEAAVLAPAGVAVSVTPSRFQLTPGQSQTLTIVADVSAVTEDGWKFGQVVLTRNGRQNNTAPETRLTMAINAFGGSARTETLYFHGNANDGCTGSGTLDLSGCGGPFLKADPVLDSSSAAAFGPVSVVLNCTVARCEVDPNWLWQLSAPTTVGGPMTVEWWVASPATSLLLSDDFYIRIWADSTLVSEQRVRHNVPAPGVATRLQSTVLLPETTANGEIVLHVDPIFINQDQSVFYYDSTQACPGATAGTCDSQVQMPVINR